jgi:cell wall-active antibiotic response 4TMS protein YvqF
MRYRHGGAGAGVFTGLVLLTLGIILLLGNLDVFQFRPDLGRWWPAFLILFGIKHLVVWRGLSALIGGAFWIGTGALFLSSTLGYLNIGVLTLMWPVMLIWFGVLTLMGYSGCNASINGRSES